MGTNSSVRRRQSLGVSYTTDALGDLVRAAMLIATGAQETKLSFDGEPMEWRVLIASLYEHGRQTGSISIDVLTFPDIYEYAPNETGSPEFHMECAALDFVRAVADCAQKAKNGYEWLEYPFPAAALRAVEAVLATP